MPSQMSAPCVDGVEACGSGQRLVIDDDQVGCVLGERGGLGDDHGDRLAGEAHLVLGKQRLRRLLDLRPVAVLDHAATGIVPVSPRSSAVSTPMTPGSVPRGFDSRCS